MAGYSGKPLAQKLGFKSGQRVAIVGAPQNYRELLGEVPEGVTFSSAAKSADAAHVFARTMNELTARIAKARAIISDDGMIWASWPKKASGVATDITEDAIRAWALANGLVDIKVCAVDETWSGLKLVVPVAMRKAASSSKR